jgi:hypothetical protein
LPGLIHDPHAAHPHPLEELVTGHHGQIVGVVPFGFRFGGPNAPERTGTGQSP